jgi:hypothetical protein
MGHYLDIAKRVKISPKEYQPEKADPEPEQSTIAIQNKKEKIKPLYEINELRDKKKPSSPGIDCFDPKKRASEPDTFSLGRELYDKRGYVIVYSEPLGEEIILVDEDRCVIDSRDSFIDPYRIRRQTGDRVIYTKADIRELSKKDPIPMKELKAWHEAKRIFGGSFISLPDDASEELKSWLPGERNE